MGNVIYGGREKKIDFVLFIVIVRDVGVFKVKVNEVRCRWELIID